jgi:hypothetical protein
VDALVVDGRSEAMMLNWLLDDARSENNEHTEVQDDLWRKVKHTIFGSVCSDSFDDLRENNSLGRLFAPCFQNVGRLISEYVDCEKSDVFFMLTSC